MTDSRPERLAITGRNPMHLGSSAISAAVLLGRGVTPAEATSAPCHLTERKSSLGSSVTRTRSLRAGADISPAAVTAATVKLALPDAETKQIVALLKMTSMQTGVTLELVPVQGFIGGRYVHWFPAVAFRPERRPGASHPGSGKRVARESGTCS